MGQESFTDQIRGAVDSCGRSRVDVCKASGIDQATMSRFMHAKGGLSMDGLDRLAAVLGLKIAAEPRDES